MFVFFAFGLILPNDAHWVVHHFVLNDFLGACCVVDNPCPTLANVLHLLLLLITLCLNLQPYRENTDWNDSSLHVYRFKLNVTHQLIWNEYQKKHMYAWLPYISALTSCRINARAHMNPRQGKSCLLNTINVTCYWCNLNLIAFYKVYLFNKFLPVPFLQTAAVTGTLPHPGHKTLRKWERCHLIADITPHWSPVIHQTFTNHHARRRLRVAETGTGTGTGLGQIRWTTKAGNLTPTIITPGITITVKVPPDSSLQTIVTAVAVATRRAEAAKSRSQSRRAASLNS